MENAYRRLSEAYGYAGSKYLPKIFEMCLSKQEAQFLLSLPGTVAEVATKSQIELPGAELLLRELFNKGFIFYDSIEGERRYALIKDLLTAIGISKWSDQFGKEFFDLCDRMVDEELSPGFDLEGYAFRVIPVQKTIEQETEILPYESISQIIEQAETIVVYRCMCRTIGRRCNNPVETCFAFDETAKYILERGVAKEVSKEEALSTLNMCEDAGLVHQVANASGLHGMLCNCCTCCCGYLRAQITLGRKHAAVKSRYTAVLNPELCNECGLCGDRCNFGALEIVDSKPVIDEQKCFGCGLCASKCPANAIRLVQVREPEHIPVEEAEPLFSSVESSWFQKAFLNPIASHFGYQRSVYFVLLASHILAKIPRLKR